LTDQPLEAEAGSPRPSASLSDPAPAADEPSAGEASGRESRRSNLQPAAARQRDAARTPRGTTRRATREGATTSRAPVSGGRLPEVIPNPYHD
jgi:hypothetical protein